jgi:hypothetical protein
MAAMMPMAMKRGYRETTELVAESDEQATNPVMKVLSTGSKLTNTTIAMKDIMIAYIVN